MHHDGRPHAVHLPEGCARRVRCRSRQHLAPAARLGGRLHDEASVHAHVPHSPRGSLERRRAGHGTGLRLHRSRGPGTARRAVHRRGTSSRCAACAPSTRRRSGSSCAPASPVGAACSERILPSHALSGKDPARLWTDGIDNPKTGAPIGSGPFLVERWERGTRIVLRRNPNYWGRRPRLERLVIRYRMSSLNPADWFRSGEVDVAQHFAPASPPCGRSPESRIVPGPSSSWEHLTLEPRPRRPPRAQEEVDPPGARLRPRPGSPHPGQPARRRGPDPAPAEQRRVPAPEPVLQAELEPVRPQSSTRASAPRAVGLPSRHGRHLRLRRAAAPAPPGGAPRLRHPDARRRARPRPAERDRGRGRARVRAPSRRDQTDHPQWRLRPGAIRVVLALARIRAARTTSSPAESRTITPATASGW